MSQLFPKKFIVGVQLITGVMAFAFAGFYLMTQLDIVPDGIGVFGYLDDILIGIGAFVLARKFVDRILGRVKSNKKAYSDWFEKKSLFDIFTSSKFWVTAIVVSGLVYYGVWALDAIPDAVPVFGRFDDFLLTLTAAIGLYRYYKRF